MLFIYNIFLHGPVPRTLYKNVVHLHHTKVLIITYVITIIHILLHFTLNYLTYLEFLGYLLLLFITPIIGAGPEIPPSVDSDGHCDTSSHGSE